MPESKMYSIMLRTDIASSSTFSYHPVRRAKTDNLSIALVPQAGISRRAAASKKRPLFLSLIPDHPLKAAIPVYVERLRNGEFIASFRQANLAMSGSDETEALELLADDIAHTYSVYTREEHHLGPEPKKQLRTLRQYIQG